MGVTTNTQQKVAIAELFTDEYIQKHSNYQSVQEMIKASGVSEIITPPFAIFRTYMTDFQSWDAMLQAAKAEYLNRTKISR